MDYRDFYDLEPYLFSAVHSRFAAQGHLGASDLFCIVIWKANRAKSKIAKKLLAHGYQDLDTAARALTSDIARQLTSRDRLHTLLEKWDFRLPMASAILAVLYPDEFTVYDTRVCEILGEFEDLGHLVSFDHLWSRYQAFKHRVETSAPNGLTLRDKDRYLWGKSFYEQLHADIGQGFSQ